MLRYEARSYPRYRAGTELANSLRNLMLQLPSHRNPRAAALARSMRAAAGSDAAYVQDVLEIFREQEFYYTLTPPGLARDSVDDFLFNTRQGFCGHFASAFTAMMRAAGVPARVVAGYQGGDWNPVGGYLIVRQSHAHAWSEVWFPEQGLAPRSTRPRRSRRSASSAASRPRSRNRSCCRAHSRAALPWLWQAAMLWDNLNAEWNDWIVQFDRATQEGLLHGLGFDDADWRAFARRSRRRARHRDRRARGLARPRIPAAGRRPRCAAYRRFLRRLARRSIDCAPGEAPRDFAQRVRRLRPDLAVPALAITETYLRLRYGPAPGANDLRLLRALVTRFRP